MQAYCKDPVLPSDRFLYFEVKTCHVCQITSALPPQPQRELQPIPPPAQPWYHIGVDLVCD